MADPIAQVCMKDPAKWAVPEKETFLAMVRPMVHKMAHKMAQPMANETVHKMAQPIANETAHKTALQTRLGMAQTSGYKMALLTRPPMKLGIGPSPMTPMLSTMWTGHGELW